MEQIGRGGMTSVFRAHDPQLNRHVAVKVLPSFQAEDPTFVERFRQEAQAVARLSHPNIIQVHDFGDDKGFIYIVMEYLTGGTFNDRLGRPLPLAETLDLVTPLAQALDYAHGEGIVHRDLTPANVLLDNAGRSKLSDFGLARLLEGSAGLTRADAVIGTPEYMSPEQVLGRPADQKSDLYALGIVVYQMLLGQPPFRGETPSATLMAHIHQPVPLPTAIDPEFDLRLESILIRALAKEPDDRYETAGEFVQALSTTAVEIAAEREAQPTLVEPLAPESPPVKEGLDTPTPPVAAPAPPEAAPAPPEAARDARRRGVGISAVSIAFVVLVAAVVGGLFAIGVLPPDRELTPSTLPIAAPGVPVIILVLPGLPSQLVSPDGAITINLAAGTVDSNVNLSYEKLRPEQAPALPAGFVASDKLFNLSLTSEDPAAAGPVSLAQPITITVRLSPEDIAAADGVATNIDIQHFDDDEGRWDALPTDVDLADRVARTEVRSLSIFGLMIKAVSLVPAVTPVPGLAAAAAPLPVAGAGEAALLRAFLDGQWSQVDPFARDNLHDVHFVSDEVGFIAGVGAIYRTEDGGDTWERVPVPVAPVAVAQPAPTATSVPAPTPEPTPTRLLSAGATSINFSDFSSVAALNLLGDAAKSGDILRLSPSTVDSLRESFGAAWFNDKQPVGDGFETVFQFQITELRGDGGDGFAFVIQNFDLDILGLGGQHIGYGGIPNSIAVEFDVERDVPFVDPSNNHISVHTLGVEGNDPSERASIGAVSPRTNLSDGRAHTVRIVYKPGSLTIFLDNMRNPVLEVPFDIASTLTLDNGRAWIGFTASSRETQDNDILSWSFSPVAAAPHVEGASLTVLRVAPPDGTTLIAGQEVPVGAVIDVKLASEGIHLLELAYDGNRFAEIRVDQSGVVELGATFVVPDARGTGVLAQLSGPGVRGLIEQHVGDYPIARPTAAAPTPTPTPAVDSLKVLEVFPADGTTLAVGQGVTVGAVVEVVSVSRENRRLLLSYETDSDISEPFAEAIVEGGVGVVKLDGSFVVPDSRLIRIVAQLGTASE